MQTKLYFQSLQVFTKPQIEPLTLEEAKAVCSVDSTINDYDALIRTLLKAATAKFEQETDRKIIEQTWNLYLSDWPCSENFPDDYTSEIQIPFPPLIDIVHLKYTDKNGNTSTFNASNYDIDKAREPGRLVLGYNVTWPSTSLRPSNPIEIQFKCGYGESPDDVPEDIKVCIGLLLEYWFENRSSGGDMIPPAAQAIIDNYKVFYL